MAPKPISWLISIIFHLCDYLAAAGEVIASQEGREKSVWLEENKDRLRANRWPDVLEALQPFLEDARVSDSEAPVRACLRYISNRSHQLDYQGALAAGLPVGSGEIESGHRYIFQSRFKISGAWWKVDNLEKMMALHVVRANGGWQNYWRNMDQEAASLTRTLNYTRWVLSV